jgi:hypothetical protein
MKVLTEGQTNGLLEYRADVRPLTIIADDFGMCNSMNEAIIQKDVRAWQEVIS